MGVFLLDAEGHLITFDIWPYDEGFVRKNGADSYRQEIGKVLVLRLAVKIPHFIAAYLRFPVIAAISTFVVGSVAAFGFIYEVNASPGPLSPVQTVGGAWLEAFRSMWIWAVGVFCFAGILNGILQYFGGSRVDVGKDRAVFFLGSGVLWFVIFFLFEPGFICSCHFSMPGLILSLPAILWGFYPYFFTGRGENELRDILQWRSRCYPFGSSGK